MVLAKLYENKKIASATHNIYAYRWVTAGLQTAEFINSAWEIMHDFWNIAVFCYTGRPVKYLHSAGRETEGGHGFC